MKVDAVEIFGRVIQGLIALTLAGLFGHFIGWTSAHPSDGVILQNAEWKCTESRTDLIMAGEVILPRDICISYRRR